MYKDDSKSRILHLTYVYTIQSSHGKSPFMTHFSFSSWKSDSKSFVKSSIRNRFLKILVFQKAEIFLFTLSLFPLQFCKVFNVYNCDRSKKVSSEAEPYPHETPFSTRDPFRDIDISYRNIGDKSIQLSIWLYLNTNLYWSKFGLQTLQKSDDSSIQTITFKKPGV